MLQNKAHKAISKNWPYFLFDLLAFLTADLSLTTLPGQVHYHYQQVSRQSDRLSLYVLFGSKGIEAISLQGHVYKRFDKTALT